MRKLHGAIFLTPWDAMPLMKQLALFFDKLHVLRAGPPDPVTPEEQADFDFLEDRGFLQRIPGSELDRIFKTDAWILDSLYGPESEDDYISAHLAAQIGSGAEYDCVGIRLHPFPGPNPYVVPEPPKRFLTADARPSSMETAVSVVVEEFPTPNEMCAWQDILDFKSELLDEHWGFRMFVKDLATKQQSEGEIRERLSYTLNQYSKLMKVNKIKERHSFVEVYVIPGIELAEDVAKFNLSKIAKSALAVQKRKLEIVEAKRKGPGAECGYVFEARERFRTIRQD
jgi:hypothetical protein